MGKCPECGAQIGPFAILISWEKWGKFVCPACGSKIRFSGWLFAVVVLAALFVGAERLLHYLLISHLPLWLSFSISSVAALIIMFLLPMIWKFTRQ